MKKINFTILLFLVVIIIAVFFRVYKFDEWMLFKGDSFRDAILISHSFNEGINNLPLLGPKAGGTMLRTGPIFYYIEYLSTLFFQSTSAPIFAYPVLFFSLLSIPLSFLFFRKFFSNNWSMILTALFSSSFLLIEYSRFAWNPNLIPFFALAYSYALLELFNSEKKTHKILWLVLAAISFSVSTQLHFSSFIALPIITVVFLFFNIENIKVVLRWNRVVIFLAITGLFYTPVIINDLISEGANSKQFFVALKNKPSDVSLWTKIVSDCEHFSENYLRIASGYFGNNKFLIILSLFTLLSAILANIYLWRIEKNSDKKNFLLLSLASFFVYFMLYVPLAISVAKPRFFLPMAILPFVFLGYLGILISRINKGGKFSIIYGVLLVVLLLSNLFYSSSWLRELSDSHKKYTNPRETVVLKEKGALMWWTWGHFKKAADYINNDCGERSVYYMMQRETWEFRNSIEYAMRHLGSKKPIHTLNKSVSYNSKACYYYVSITGSALSANLENFTFISKQVFGNMTIQRFNFPDSSKGVIDEAPKDDNFSLEVGEDSKPNRKRILSNKERLFWNDVTGYFKN